MGFWFSFWVWIFRIVAVGGLVTFLIILYQKQKKIPAIDRKSIVMNYNAEHTNNKAVGWLYNRVERCKNGIFRVRYVPLDQTKAEREENKMFVETILTDDVHVASKGTISGEIDIINIKPNTLAKVIRQMPSFAFKEGQQAVDTIDLYKKDHMNSVLNKNFGVGFEALQKVTPDLMQKTWRGGEMTAFELQKILDTQKLTQPPPNNNINETGEKK